MIGILGIDPGKRSGWCMLGKKGQYRASGVVDGDDRIAIAEILAYCPETIVIEGQFVGVNPKSAIQLIRRRMRWEIMAEVSTSAVVLSVHPRTWQAFFEIPPGDKEKIAASAARFCGRTVEKDEADAIMIALWFREFRKGVPKCNRKK